MGLSQPDRFAALDVFTFREQRTLRIPPYFTISRAPPAPIAAFARQNEQDVEEGEEQGRCCQCFR